MSACSTRGGVADRILGVAILSMIRRGWDLNPYGPKPTGYLGLTPLLEFAKRIPFFGGEAPFFVRKGLSQVQRISLILPPRREKTPCS